MRLGDARYPVILASVCVMLSACGAGESVAACQPEPRRLDHTDLARPGGELKVKVGTTVYVALAEPARYQSPAYPAVFPWLKPASDSSALKRVRLCRSKRVSSLAIRMAAFRASHSGTATITAALAPAWRPARLRRRSALKRYRASVIVEP